ncbi:MAG: ABC transporter ATP-binding protein [Bacteroidia bacterium]|nr:ABC transporter ATP-binding protein [Bacteroidia bacterium]
MEIFSANQVVKRFATQTALDKVSISVPEQSIFGLLGPNGAGKTTLIRIINQITAPDSGELFFNRQKLKADDIRMIGYLPEERGLYKKMKVGEQCIYLAQLKGLTKNDAMRRLKYWFEKFEIQSWWNRKVEELSKGMQQKVQFIITILHEPKLLIFDEPFSGFDPINVNLLITEILELRKKGATIIFSTHNMESVEELCDEICLIDKAKSILSGNISDIKSKYRSNTFRVVFEGRFEKSLFRHIDHCEFIEEEQDAKWSTVKFRLSNGIATNDLISSLLDAGKISSFNEVMPSMRDIFINVVQNSQE